MEDKEEMGILERLVYRDTLREALALLAPVEMLMAAGRANGMSDEEVADALGIEPVSVSCRLALARERIAAEIPELRVFLEGRRKPRVDRGRRRRKWAELALGDPVPGVPGYEEKEGQGDDNHACR